MIPKEIPEIYTEYRKICTKLPVPESLDIINKSIKYEPLSMNHQLPCVWDAALDYNVSIPVIANSCYSLLIGLL